MTGAGIIYTKNKGVCSESNYPYLAKDKKCKKKISCSRTKVRRVRRAGWLNMKRYLKKLCKTPMATAFKVVDSLYDYGSGIYNA